MSSSRTAVIEIGSTSNVPFVYEPIASKKARTPLSPS
jgi:hypothetical protein